MLESRSDAGDYIWWDGTFYYLPSGRLYFDTSNEKDIISGTADSEAALPQPQPLEWKRGIPTEEECRECWIVTGCCSNVPDSLGCVYGPGECKDRYVGANEWYLPLRIKPVEPPKPKTKTITLQQFTHPSGDKRWIVVEDCEMVGCWTATNKTKTVEVPCE